MRTKRPLRITALLLALFLLCPLLLTAASAEESEERILDERAAQIEAAMDAALDRGAAELQSLAEDYKNGVKTPTDANGDPLSTADAAALLTRLEQGAERLSAFTVEGYRLAIVEHSYETHYIGRYLSMSELADAMVAYLVSFYDLKELSSAVSVSDALIECYMASIGDKFASYYDEKEYASYEQDTNAEYSGIGVTVTLLEDGYVEVLSVSPDSPAERADMRVGDVITAVDGEDFAELGYTAAVNKMRGEVGTSVTVTFKRGDEILERTLVRTLLTEYTVRYKILKAGGGKIGYIHISQFDLGTFEQFVDAVETLGSQGAEKYIFDVRNNPGGRADTVLAILEYILPDSELSLVHLNYKNESHSYKSVKEYLLDNGGSSELIDLYKDARDHEIAAPYAVLCNEYTISAGELFASCIKDFGTSVLIGTKTYGKGHGQTGYYLTDYYAYGGKNMTYYANAVFNVSSLYYSPPTSPNYNEIGVVPNIVATLSEEAANTNFYKLTEEMDAQLSAAVDYLSDKAGVPYEPKGEPSFFWLLWVLFALVLLVGALLVAFLIVSIRREKKQRDDFFAVHGAKGASDETDGDRSDL